MPLLVPYQPNPKQAPFHKSTAFERLLVGGFGSGKSYAIVAEAIAWMLEQPGIRGLIARATIPGLKASTESIFVDLLPPELWKQCRTTRVGGHYDSIIFPNGSEVHFKSLYDWKGLRSINYGFIAIDEADEIDLETYDGMIARVRQTDPTALGREHGAERITRIGVWMAMNPAGHTWHWERFVKDNPNDGSRDWFRTTTFDNPYTPPQFIANMLAYPPQWIRRYVLAAWDDFAGAIYEAWTGDHIVARYPFDPMKQGPAYPPHALHWMALDPGMRDPTAGLWVVVERQPRLRIVGVAEYQEEGLDVLAHARAFRRIEAQYRLRPVKRIGDPNRINTRDLTTPTRLADAYRRAGFRFDLGASKFDDRIPALGTLIANGQFVVTEDCPITYQSIRDARWKDLTDSQRLRGEAPPEKPEKLNRHLCDCAEYIATQYTRPIAAPDVLPDHMPDWQREAIASVRKRLAKVRTPAPHRTEGIVVQ
jgi:PBSX family phage terminase large subunit